MAELDVGGVVVFLDDDLLEQALQYRWHRVGTKRQYVAANRRTGSSRYLLYLHRWVVSAPEGMLVDHINRNTFDCRRANLRLCSVAENGRNSSLSKRSVSGLKGAFPHSSGKWASSIRVNGRNIHLGLFDSAQEAHDAYCRHAREHYGAFWSDGAT